MVVGLDVGFLLVAGRSEGQELHSAVLEMDAAAGPAVDKGFDGGVPQPRRQDPVDRSRPASALDVAEDGDARLEPGRGRHRRGDGRCRRPALGDDDDPARLAPGASFLDLSAQGFERHVLFREQDLLAAAGQGDLHGEPAAFPAHDLDDENALEGRRRVPDLVDGVQGDVDGRVGPDGVFDAGDVVVDRGRDADDREAVSRGQDAGAGEGAVAADDDESFDRTGPDIG